MVPERGASNRLSCAKAITLGLRDVPRHPRSDHDEDSYAEETKGEGVVHVRKEHPNEGRE